VAGRTVPAQKKKDSLGLVVEGTAGRQRNEEASLRS
jgi:hypothetical protein